MHSVPACQDSMPHPPPIEADTGREATGLRFGDQCHRPSPGVRGVQVLPHHLVPDIKTPGGNPEGQLNHGGLLQLIHLRLGQEHGPPGNAVSTDNGPYFLLQMWKDVHGMLGKLSNTLSTTPPNHDAGLRIVERQYHTLKAGIKARLLDIRETWSSVDGGPAVGAPCKEVPVPTGPKSSVGGTHAQRVRQTARRPCQPH